MHNKLGAEVERGLYIRPHAAGYSYEVVKQY